MPLDTTETAIALFELTLLLLGLVLLWRLVLSPNTVHRHRTSLMQKLGLHDRLDLLRYCIRRGLVDSEA